MIGATELLFVACLWGIVTIAYFLRARFSVTAIAFAVCMTVASVATPADLASCLFIGILLFTAYQIGGRFGSPRIPARHSGLQNRKIEFPAAESNGDQVSNPYAPPTQSQTRTNK